MTCTCSPSARPYLHHVGCIEAAMLRHPSNTSTPTDSRAVEPDQAPAPSAVDAPASGVEALSPTDVAKALTSAAQAIGLLTQRVIELHAEVEQMKAQMQHSVVYVPVAGEVT